MFFWRRVALQSPEDDLKPTASPGYARNFRDLNDLVAKGKSFSGRERNSLFLNRKGEGFTEVGGLLGVDFPDDARAVATMDWDRDGDLDLWVTNRGAPQVRLLLNNHPSPSSSLAIRLVGNGTTTNRDAIGARLVLSESTASEPRQIRTVRAGEGFLSQSSAWSHFGLGLGKASANFNLSVAWPGGQTEIFSGLKAGSRSIISQGTGQPDPSLSAKLTVPPTRPETIFAPIPTGLWVANRVPFPELTYTDDAGANRSTSSFHGKPFLINLWATWCEPCIRELGAFGTLGEFLSSRDTAILALNVDGLAADGNAVSSGTIQEVLKRAGYNLPHGMATRETLAKLEVMMEFLTSRRDPLTIPSSFLVDGEGNIAAMYAGAIDAEQLSRDIKLLRESPSAQLKRATPREGRWFTDPRQIDRAAYLGDYATSFATGGLSDESQRLTGMITPQDGALSAHDYYNQAKTAARQGLAKEAEELYRKALRLKPNYSQALTGLGALLLMQKRVEEAEDLFEKALGIDPNHATALINLAMIDQSRGDRNRALGRLQKVVARNPDYAEAHLNLGSLLASMKQYDKAITHLSRAIELNPERAVAHLNLASVYLAEEDWEKAEEQFRLVLRLNPKVSHAHLGLATLQARKDLHAEAVVSFRNAIALGARNASSYQQLGLSLLALGDKKAASEALDMALRLDPDDSEAKRLREQAGLPD